MLAQVGLVLALLANVHAYSFKFTNYVTQCGPLSIELTDGAGTPPYNLLLIPQGAYGPPEIRHIQNVQFSNNTYTIDKLAYPANTQFLAMLSDSKGIGTGGTSIAIRVETSGDTSCLGTTQVAPDFLFYIDSAPNVECVTTNLRWQDSVQGQIHIYGVIPGGQSFEIPLPSSGTTATWVTDVRAGTTVQFVASDNRGIGNGGSSELYTIQQGTSQACFANGPVYATTTGNPAGPIIPTGPSSSHPSGGGSGGGGTPDSPVNFSSSPSTGVIVGAVVGVVGGFALIALLGFFLYRRYRRRHRNAGTKEVDLLPPLAGSENHGDTEQYAADPYVVPAMRSTSRLSQTTSGYPDLPLSSNGRRMSESTMTRSEVPLNGRRSFDMSESDAGRSSIQKRPLSGGLHPPSAMRPINIIQHDDGGAVVEDPPSPVTVELPPSYHNIRGKPTDPQPGITDALSSSS